MPPLTIFLLLYFLFTLATLAFRPVRLVWEDIFFDVRDSFVGALPFKYVAEEPIWWKKIGRAIEYIFFYLLLVVVIILILVVFSVLVYYLVLRDFKKLKKRAKERDNLIPSWEKWGANTDQSFVEFDKDLPFTPNMYEVFYVEDEYDPAVNKYILEHYDELCELFISNCLTFNYLPKICKQKVPEDVLRYMCPFLDRIEAIENGEITLETLRQHLVTGDFVGPALIHYRHDGKDNPEKYYFSYRPLVPRSSVPLPKQFQWYVKNVSFSKYRGVGMTNIGHIEDEDKADFFFHNENFELFTASSEMDLIDEIRARVFALRKRGLQLHWIQEMLEMPPKLSRLVVDKEFRIFLPDYNNLEITMSPLPKSVYLLFLKHPEGIAFKQLSDYYAELLDIYKQVGNRMVESAIEKSIRDITDPTKNSINEKCARIREAFVSKFDTLYAQHYYITGQRGEPKRIDLPRDLVDLQAL